MSGIYIHIPFCKKRCAYCDFFSSTALARKEEVLRVIRGELAARAGFLGGDAVRTLYIGGGTPSLCAPAEIGELVALCGRLFDTSGLAEVTLEANPDDLSPAYLAALRTAGVNRLSIGVQSFIDRDLRWMNRRHDASAAREAIAAARRAGFDNLSLDLIYGLPQMSLREWEYNIRELLAFAPEHVSAYHLTFERNTPLGRMLRRGEISEIGEEQSARQFDLLHGLLAGAGYEHYEVSSFALPGRRAVHNSGYWYGVPYLGVGPSAHSYDGRVRQWNVAGIPLYLERVSSGTQFDTEKLTVADRYNEYVMTALRCDRGADAGEIGAAFGEKYARRFRETALKFLRTGILRIEGGRCRIPAERYLISDGIIAEFFDTE